MKKLLLGLGAATAAIAPIATVVACGSSSDSNESIGIKINEKVDKNTKYLIEKFDSKTPEEDAVTKKWTLKLTNLESKMFLKKVSGSEKKVEDNEDVLEVLLTELMNKNGIKKGTPVVIAGVNVYDLSMGSYGPKDKPDVYYAISFSEGTNKDVDSVSKAKEVFKAIFEKLDSKLTYTVK